MKIKVVLFLFLTINLGVPLGFIPFNEASAQEFTNSTGTYFDFNNGTVNHLTFANGTAVPQIVIPDPATPPDFAQLSEPPFTVSYDMEQFPDQALNIIDNGDTITIENKGVSSVYNKDTCSLSLFNPNEIETEFAKESWSVHSATWGSDNWNGLPVNSESCETGFSNTQHTATIDAVRQNDDGIFRVQYSFDLYSIKTTVYYTNYNENTFGGINNDGSVWYGNPTKFGFVNSFSSMQTDVSDLQDGFTQSGTDFVINEQYDIEYKFLDSTRLLWGINNNVDNIYIDFKNVSKPTQYGQSQVIDPHLSAHPNEPQNVDSDQTEVLKIDLDWDAGSTSSSSLVVNALSETSDNINLGDGTYQWRGEKFEGTGSSSFIGKTISKVTIPLKIGSGTLSGDITVSILDNSGNTKQTLGIIDSSTLTSSYAEYTVENTSASYTIAQNDGIYAYYDGDSSNYIQWKRSSGVSVYDGSDSNRAYSTDGSTFTGGETEDMLMAVYELVTLDDPTGYRIYEVSSARDSSLDGTNNGATTGVTGKLNNAWSFDGNNDYVTIGDDSSFSWINNPDAVSSISFWYKSDSNPSNTYDGIMGTTDVSWGDRGFEIGRWQSSGAGIIELVDNSKALNDYITNTGLFPTDDDWYHYVFIFDDGNDELKIYKDNSLFQTISYSSWTPSTDTSTKHALQFAYDTANNRYANIQLDEVIFYDIGIDTSAIDDLYNLETPSTTNMKAHYDFEQTGNTLENQALVDTNTILVSDTGSTDTDYQVTQTWGTTTSTGQVALENSAKDNYDDNVDFTCGSCTHIGDPYNSGNSPYHYSPRYIGNQFYTGHELIGVEFNQIKVGLISQGTQSSIDGTWHVKVFSESTYGEISGGADSQWNGKWAWESNTGIDGNTITNDYAGYTFGDGTQSSHTIADNDVIFLVSNDNTHNSSHFVKAPKTSSSGGECTSNGSNDCRLIEWNGSEGWQDQGGDLFFILYNEGEVVIPALESFDSGDIDEEFTYKVSALNEATSSATKEQTTDNDQSDTFGDAVLGQQFLTGSDMIGKTITNITFKGQDHPVGSNPETVTLGCFDGDGNLEHTFGTFELDELPQSYTVFNLSGQTGSYTIEENDVCGVSNEGDSSNRIELRAWKDNSNPILPNEQFVGCGGQFGSGCNARDSGNSDMYYEFEYEENVTYESDLSSSTSWTLQDDLPAPTNLTAQSGIPIQLDWDDVANAVTYQVYRDSGSGFTLLANAGSDSDYDDSSTVAGTSYDYKVSALGPNPANLLESALSSQVTATAGQPPDAITTVTATISNAQTDPHVVTLTWGEPSDWQTGTPQSYEVFESVGSSGNMQSVSSALTYVAGTFTHTHNISGIQPLTDYYYMVRATSTHGTSADSNTPSVTTVDVPVKPDTPVATQPDTTATPYLVNLSWSDNGDGGSDIKGHQIDRWDSNSNAWTTIETDTGSVSTTYQDTSIVSPAIDVRYKIGVINGVGVSTLSDQSNTITIPDIPLVPNNVSCTTDSSTQITVTWEVPSSDGGSALTYYNVYQPHPSNQVQYATNVYTHVATGLTQGTLYQFDVSAQNNVGDGSYASCTATTSIAPAGTFSITQDWIVYDTMEVSYLAVISAGNPSPTVEDIKIKLDGTTVATVPIGSQVSIGQQLTGTLQIKLPDLVQHDLTADMRMTNTGNEVTVTSNTLSVIATFLPTYKPVVEGTGEVAWQLSRDEAQTSLNIEIFKDTAPFDVNCALLEPQEASEIVDRKITSMPLGIIWQNATSVGYHNATSTVDGNLSYYVFCYEKTNPYLLMFSDTSYTTLGSALASGLSGIQDSLGPLLGGPLIGIFVLMLAGQATGRTAPTFIIITIVAVGILMGLGFFIIDEYIWGLILIMGCLGVLVGKKFL